LFGRPKGWYLETGRYLGEGAVGERGALLWAAEDEHLEVPPPRAEFGERHWELAKPPAGLVHGAKVYQLSRVRFWGHYGGNVISSDDRLLADLSLDVLGIERHSAFSRLKLPRCRRLPGTIAVLSTPEAATNYWHWTTDLLPRIQLLAEAGYPPSAVTSYLVNHRNLHYQWETLRDFGVQPEQVIQVWPSSHYEIDKLVISSPKSDPEQHLVTRRACSFLRGVPVGEGSSSPSCRLYVSRRRSQYRRISNETEIVALLRLRGFLTVELDELAVAEQRALFARAEAVVGCGSGLTNILYCPGGTPVIEFMPPRLPNFDWWALCSQLHLPYWRIMGEGGCPPGDVVVRDPAADFSVGLEHLRQALGLAGL